MNTFSVLLQVCGMTPHDAAHLMGVPPRVVIRWTKDVGEPSDGVMEALGVLQARQQDVADAIITSWDEAGRPPRLSIAVARDDEEARSMGWPSLAAQVAPAAIAQAVLGPIKIVLEQGASPGAAPAPNPAAIAAE